MQVLSRTGAGVFATGNLGAGANNYDPGSAGIIRATPTADITWTGLVAGPDGSRVIIQNVGTFALTLAAESASSTAANRFKSPKGDTIIGAGSSVEVFYDATAARWVVLNPYTAGVTITVSSSAPSGGNSGDIWYQKS